MKTTKRGYPKGKMTEQQILDPIYRLTLCVECNGKAVKPSIDAAGATFQEAGERMLINLRKRLKAEGAK